MVARTGQRAALFASVYAAAAALSLWSVAAAQADSSADVLPEINDLVLGADEGQIYANGVLDQFEVDVADDRGGRWEGEVWAGSAKHRLWLRSQGEIDRRGDVAEGQLDVLYDHPISTFFDVQAGLRYDLDARPGRTWAAFGVEGHVPYLFKGWATVYLGEDGRLAAALRASYDRLLTERLVLQPEARLDLYSQTDSERRIGSGVAALDLGLRLRYEASERFAPYLGVTYRRRFGETAELARFDGEHVSDARLVVGLRTWF